MACCIAGAISAELTRIWFLLSERMASGRPRASSSTDCLAFLNFCLFSSCGRSEATAIIIPKTVETKASIPSGTRIRASRTRFRRGFRRGPPLDGELPSGR